MTTQNKIVPALRFPEFSEEWEIKKLGEIAEFKAGYAFKSQTMLNKPSNFQLIKMSNVYQNQLRLDRNPSFWKNIDSKQKEFLLKKGDVVLTLTGTVGKKDYGYSVMINEDRKFLLNQRLVLLREIPQKSISNFINQLLSNERFLFHFFSEAKGGTGNQTNVSTEDVKNIRLPLPTLPEQQKIAAFLTEVDKKIQQLAKKKDLLEQYKKGVMQKIFNQEMRFKDDNGNDFADWEEMKFGEIFSFRTTNSFSRENLNYETGEVKNIHYGDVHTKFNSQFDITKEYVPFINNDISLKKIAEDNYCKIGDLVIADASEDYADIGKCIEITNLNNEKVLAGLHTFLARPDLYKMAVGYSGYMMKSGNVRLQVMTIAQGTKVLSISTGRLAKVKLTIPSEPEQKKIANFLSQIDNKINLVNQQLENTKEYKRGLLQQMFI